MSGVPRSGLFHSPLAAVSDRREAASAIPIEHRLRRHFDRADFRPGRGIG